MRTKVGWAVSIAGGLCAVIGLAAMLVLGPDSRFTTGPHSIDTDGIAVVTAPSVISWKSMQVDVLAEVPVNKPVFVGIGNTVDVQDYVKDTRRLEITSFSRPWNIESRTIDGRDGLSGAPTALDWWLAGSAGLGGARISTQLPDETVSAAVLSVGASNLQGLEISYAYGVRGGFAKGFGLLLGGVGAIWGGLLVRRNEGFTEREDEDDDDTDTVFARRRPVDDDSVEEVEEVVYVYVDEDGVEHEISEDEAAGYEVVEVVVEDEAEDVPSDVDEESVEAEEEADPKPEPEPEPRSRATTGVLTAADILAGVDSTTPPPEPEPKPEPTPERVVYVYVDDDGVEHEVSEDELDDFEFVDEDEADEADDTEDKP